MYKKSVSLFSVFMFAGVCAASAGPLDPGALSHELVKISSESPLAKALVQSGILTNVVKTSDYFGSNSFVAAAAIKDSAGEPDSVQKWLSCSYTKFESYDGMSRAPQWKTTYNGCSVFKGVYFVEGSAVSFDELKTLTALDLLSLVGTPVQSSAAE
jgi:hypothetical protein